MNGAFNVLIEPITRYEGTLARLMGDAILAFFGAPIAHEDDPDRACRAAIEIINGAKQFGRKLELEKGIKGFSVRVGINTGLVVVAEVGTDLRVEYTAMGDAVNIAARMESAAKPGSILITEATKKLLHDVFDMDKVGPIIVKGKSDPIIAYQVKGMLDKIKNISQGYPQSQIVGRETELLHIQDSIKQLQSGEGRILSIVGQHGVGKSRLVSEISNSLPSTVRWAEGRALTYTSNHSYWVARSVLKNLLGYHQETNDLKMFDDLHHKIKSHFENSVEEIYPYIENLLDPSAGKNQMRSIEIDAQTFKGQIHYAVKQLIKKESIGKPLILVWEDLQWCDSSSLDFLNDLLSLTEEVPLLLVLVYRIDENEKKIWNFHYNNLAMYTNKHEVISINPLDDHDSILLIEKLLGDRTLPMKMKNQIIERTEGNPSFLEEVIHSLIEKGFFENKTDKLSKISIGKQFQIPKLLPSVVMTRIDCLMPADKLTLQTASVIGRIFQKRLLSQIMQSSIIGDEFEKSLKELQSKELILRHLPMNIHSTKSIIEKEFIFKHNITHDVVYNSMLLSHRERLHRQIAEVIENLNANRIEEFTDTLAIHFEKGKVLNKAIHYNKLAAERAKDIFANEQAIYFYTKTLKLLEEKPVELFDLAQIHHSLGEVYSLTAKYSLAIDHYKKSLKYYKDPNTIAQIYYKSGQAYERLGKYEMALEEFNNGLSLLGLDTKDEHTALIYSGIGMVYYRMGNIVEAEKFNNHALSILEENGNELYIAETYNNLGIIYCQFGELEKSLEYHQKCLIIRENIGAISGLAASNNNLGYLYQLKNDLERAVEYYNKSIEYCEKMGNLHGMARTYDNLSQVFMIQGNEELAKDYNLKSIEIIGKIAKDGFELESEVWLQSGVW
ncbi:MAG: tetratricopeptide repeat protein, partial [Candidatus Kariarchaeaceae archaeon]|jgi:predicted ATPase